MTTHMELHTKAARFGGAVSLLVFVVAITVIVTGSAPPEERRIDLKNFEILGISLGSSTIEDVRRILGPAPEMKSTDPENTVMCYASPGIDRTILEFENWIDPIEFRIFHGSMEEVARCASSAKICDSLSTAAGLKLGMSQHEVISILGRPTKTQGGHFLYEAPHLRPLTPEEQKRATGTYPPPRAVEVYEKLDIQFSESKVIRIDVVHSETW